MDAIVKTEKEWLRKITGGKTLEKTEQKASPKTMSQDGDKKPDMKRNKGFADVAGMEELKKLVTEGFINVLNNQECAKMYGITPPSLLFYGPAGCGKTFSLQRKWLRKLACIS